MTMKSQITIIQLNYFTSLQMNNIYNNKCKLNIYNSKVLYKKNNKTYLAHVYVDFFNKCIYESKQPKEGKVLSGLMNELNTWANNKNFIF